MERGLDLGCLIAMRECHSRSKIFKVKKFSTFFQNGFFHVSGLWDNFNAKNFFRLSDHSESEYRNVIPKAETPPYLSSEKAHSPCSDHMERGLDLRCLIAMRGQKVTTSQKFFLVQVLLDFRSVLRHNVLGQNFVGQDVAGAISLGQIVVGQEVSGAGRRGAELRGAGRHWGNIPGAKRRGAGGQWGRTSWGRTSWGRTSLGQYPWGRSSWGRRLVGQDVVGQNFVGQDVTGAISLGQEVSGAGGSGAGSIGNRILTAS